MNDKKILEMLTKVKGLGTSSDLARAIGVTPQYIFDVFRGHRKPSGKVLEFLGYERVTIIKPAAKKRKAR